MPTRRTARARFARRLRVILLIVAATGVATPVFAGGQGAAIPPVPLPVRETELRIASQARMVCVADPGTVCVAPYLDAPTGSTNSDGGTFRSASCPGSPHGACRPDYVTGADLTGELVVDWPITRLENVGACGSSPVYEICHDGHIELNLTAPGVAVANPIASLDSTDPEYPGEECTCIDPDFDVESQFNGETLEPYWQTRNVGATCDIALEYATLVPRAKLLSIGREAFPSLLCQPDASGACTIEPVPVLVEPDGSLTKGCGVAPSNTFTIRFAHRSEPLAFVRKPLSASPLAIGDTGSDGLADLIQTDAQTVGRNDGNNLFSPQPSGLSIPGLQSAAVVDWTDDGDPDLVAKPQTSPASGLTVFPGDGAGTFDDVGSFVVDATLGATLLEAVDLNDDGLPDAVSDTGASTNVVWNQTGGPVSPAIDAVATDTRAVADLDADADADLLGVRSVPPVQAIEWSSNTGPGGFAVQNAVDVPTETDALVPLLGQDVVDLLRCDEYASDCCSANGTAGCDDTTCEDIVCSWDFGCCSFAWDETCRDLALEKCGICKPPATPDCCSERPVGSGCEVSTCEAIVCGQYPSCCSGQWDDFCAEKARGWCTECHDYNVICSASVADVDAADVDGDGDADLCLAVDVDLDLIQTTLPPGADGRVAYFAWLPNRQVDDPQSSSGQPLFDPLVDPWRIIGRAPADREKARGPIDMVDLDGDADPDAVGVGLWYRNDGGVFSGPYALGRGSPGQSCGVDGLVGYWRFDGDATDTTPCGTDGTVNGASPAPDVDGTPDAAWAFDGVDDVIDLGSAAVLKPELPVAVSMWVRHDCSSLCRVFGNDIVSGTSYSGLWVNITGTGQLAAGFGDAGGSGSGNRRSATGSTILAPNVWHHVVVQFPSAPGGSFLFYVDGVHEFPSQSGTGGDIGYLGNAALIGNDSSGTVGFTGTLDEIRLYARTLATEEVGQLAEPGDAPSSLPSDPFESLDLDTLIVKDIDADGDTDVVADDVLWERVPVPEPGILPMLAAGLAALGALHRRRRRR